MHIRISQHWQTCVLGITLSFILVFNGLLTTAQQTDVDPTLAIIARLNDWRITEGLAPFKPNATLTALAQSQVDFLMEQSKLPSDDAGWHKGRSGESPPERAVMDPYDWPSYNNPEQINIGEIAAVGGVDFALDFWHKSSIHHKTVVNPDYREVGVAAARYGLGYLFIVDFGGRPNILPALADPAKGVVYLTNERYPYAKTGPWIFAADRMRLFDSNGISLSDDWVDWEAVVTIPEGVGDKMYILSTDGEAEVIAEADLTQDAVLLPGSVPTLPPPATATVTPSPAPTQTPQMLVVAPTETTSPTAKVTASPVPADTATATLTPAGPEVLIVYDKRSLAVLNQAGKAIDLDGLVLGNAVYSLPMKRWATTNTALRLDAFPHGGCVQVWGWSESSAPDAPEDCQNRWSVLTIAPNDFFWAKDDFSVTQNGTELAVCAVGAERCEVDLP